jgi:5-methylcytosine-specific restriction endonuclease McrA
MSRPRLRYAEYIQSDRWRRKRAQALRHYRGRCLICGQLGADSVHHATYIHLGAERMHELAPMHEACHDAVTEVRSALRARGGGGFSGRTVELAAAKVPELEVSQRV